MLGRLFQIAIVCSCIAAGCASMESHVVARASRDFSCAREETVITDVLGGLYRLEGCGFAATYDCQENSSLRVSCTPVGGTQSVTAHAASSDR